jgi:hypothetical protein
MTGVELDKHALHMRSHELIGGVPGPVKSGSLE